MIQLERKTIKEMEQTFEKLFILDRVEFEEIRMKNDLFLAKIEYLEGYLETDLREETQHYRNAKNIMDGVANNQMVSPEIKILDDDEIAEVLATLLFIALFEN